MQYLGSLVFTLFFYVSTMVWSVVVSLTPFVSHTTRFEVVRVWARAVMTCLRWCCNLRFEVEGSENFSAGPAVFLQKHSSAWETVAGIVYCPPHTWVLKRELMWLPVLNFALRAMRTIPINRKGRQSAVNQVIEHGGDRLARGINVMIYPEGTRVEPGRNGRFGRSGAKLAVSASVPVIPIAHNAGDYWGRNRLLKRAGTIRVVIGEPIVTRGRTAEEVNALAAAWMDATMARISTAHAGAARQPA